MSFRRLGLFHFQFAERAIGTISPHADAVGAAVRHAGGQVFLDGHRLARRVGEADLEAGPGALEDGLGLGGVPELVFALGTLELGEQDDIDDWTVPLERA